MADWDQRFLDLARFISTWSKDPSTKCGAVIADQHNVIVAVGFNGFPRRVPDRNQYLFDRAEKYKRVIHAETNAILFSRTIDQGTTIYTYPCGPCPVCAALIIQAGIQRVVFPQKFYEDILHERGEPPSYIAKDMFDEAGVQVLIC